MEEIISQIFQVGFFTAIIRIATPFVFATIGELFAERSGVLNLGIEGIMMFGAMTGFSTAYFTSSLWLGILAAMLTGMLMAALMGFLTVSLGLSQHVSGIGITMLSTGFAFFFLPEHFRPAVNSSKYQSIYTCWHSSAKGYSMDRASFI
jgi:simple sugar transport system permease protein